MGHDKPHGTWKGLRSCSDTPFPQTIAPTWTRDQTDQEGGRYEPSPWAQRREPGASPAMLPWLSTAFSPPSPCWMCCVGGAASKAAISWTCVEEKVQEGRWCLCRGGGRRVVSRLSALLAPFLPWSTVQTVEAIKYEMNKTKSVTYCPKAGHNCSPWRVFKCILLLLCF